MTTTHPDYAKTFRDDYVRNADGSLYDILFGAHARRKGPRFDQMRAFNAEAFTIFGEVLQGKKAIYREGAISKGMRAHYHAKRNGPFVIEDEDGGTRLGFNVFDLDEKIGSQTYVADIIQPNTRTQIEGLSYLRGAYPDRAVIVPIFLQGAAFLAGQPNFDRGTKRKDKDYMVLWGAVVNEYIDMLPVIGDWPFTAMTNVEISLGLEVAAGRVARRPQADMDFRDSGGNYVGLFDIAARRLEYLNWAAENQFDLAIEPTLLMHDFKLAGMAQRGELPNANPAFLHAVRQHRDELADLQRVAEPFLLEQVRAKHFTINPQGLEALPRDFHAALEAEKNGTRTMQPVQLPEKVGGFTIRRFIDDDLRQGIYDRTEIEKLRQRSFTHDHAALHQPPMRDVDLTGKTLEQLDGRSIFSRTILPELTERETMQAKFVLGVAESVMLPAGRTVFLVADDKYGPYLKDDNLAYGDEGAGVTGRRFMKDVRLPHRELIRHAQAMLEKDGHVISSSALQRLYGLFQAMPEFAVAPGEAMPGSAARLLARHAYMARNVTDFAFKDGMWEQSNDGLQDMLHATRIQLGLEAGTEGDVRAKRVFADNGQPLTLLDRAMAILPPLQKALEKGRDAQDMVEPATALAQLWGYHRLIHDHPLAGHVFGRLRDEGIHTPHGANWHQIPQHAIAYDPLTFEQKWQNEIRPLLVERLAPAVRLRHLDAIEDFAEIKRRQDALHAIAMGGQRPDMVRLVKRGGVVPQHAI